MGSFVLKENKRKQKNSRLPFKELCTVLWYQDPAMPAEESQQGSQGPMLAEEFRGFMPGKLLQSPVAVRV